MGLVKALEGRKALVTGGTRGIGWAIAQRLVEEGCQVVLTGTQAGAAGPAGSAYRQVDFSNRAATEAFAKSLQDFGLDVLVNNAGINKISQFDLIDPSDFDRILEVNLRAAFLCCRAVVPGMRRQRWGRIVNIASIFGVVSKELRASYSTSKFGLDGMTAALAAEIAAEGVLANCVSPGFIETDLTKRVLGEAGIKELTSRVPMRRLGKPEEVAALVCWLAGPENTFISGQNIVIDGGFTRV